MIVTYTIANGIQIRRDETVKTAPIFVILTDIDILQESTSGVIAWVTEEQDAPNWLKYKFVFLLKLIFCSTKYNLDPNAVNIPLIGSKGFYWTYLSDEAPLDPRWDIYNNVGKKFSNAVAGIDHRDPTGKPHAYRYHRSLETLFVVFLSS